MKKIVIFTVLPLMLIAGALGAYHVLKSQKVDQQFKEFLKSRFSDNFGLKISVGKIHANPAGLISVDDLELTIPNPDGSSAPIFLAKTISFKYSLIDMFKENFSGWLDITLDRPTFYSNVPFEGKVRNTGSLEIFSGLVHKVKKKTRLIVKSGTVVWVGQEGVLSEISGTVEGKSFDFKLSLNHIQLHGFDVSTTLHMIGVVSGETANQTDPKLIGQIITDGSIVNWKPVPEESSADFEITKNELKITSAKVLGGIMVSGVIGHSSSSVVDLSMETEQYPLAQMYDIMSFTGGSPIGTLLDAKLFVKGSVYQPNIEGQVTIQNPDGKDKKFKNIQLNFTGVYPEVTLSESRMVASNGSVMRFSTRQLPVRELFKTETYERMIRQTEQTSVAWGDWTLARREDEDSVWLEKSLADDMTLTYQRYDHDETRLNPNSLENENELSLEYFLSKKGSVSMDIRDDEQLVSLKSTTSF